MALAHNGNLINSYELRTELENEGSIFHTTSDTEVISYMITKERVRTRSIEEAVLHAMGHALPNNATPSLLTINKHKGFDCPGCAWPEPDQADLNIVEFCENGAKAVAEETTPKKADAAFWADYSVSELREKTDHWLGKVGRITEPLLYDRSSGDDHYRPVSWDKAIGIIAEQLQRTEPDEAVFYTSGKAPNESAYAIQLLARRMGTNNLPDCSNMCHESTGAALSATLGLGKEIGRASCRERV